MWASGIRVCSAADQCYPYGRLCQRDVKLLSYSLPNTASSSHESTAQIAAHEPSASDISFF